MRSTTEAEIAVGAAALAAAPARMRAEAAAGAKALAGTPLEAAAARLRAEVAAGSADAMAAAKARAAAKTNAEAAAGAVAAAVKPVAQPPAAGGYDANDPATWARGAATMYVGLDLGMFGDHSAYTLAGLWSSGVIGAVDFKQFPLGTPFELVAAEAVQIAVLNQATIVFDASSNVAFAETLAGRLPRRAIDRVIAAALTGADDHNATPDRMHIMVGGALSSMTKWSLSKGRLITTTQAELHAETLRLAYRGDWAIVMKELKTMGAKRTARGHISYNAPSGQHDDLVTSLMLAAWACRYLAPRSGSGSPGRFRPPRRRAPSPLAWT